MKNPFTGLLLIVCLFCTQFSFAQPICGFDALHRKAMNTDPQFKKAVLSNDTLIQTIIQEKQARRALSQGARISSATAAVLYTIPVVVHVVHTGGAVGSVYNPSDADITGAINYLNQIYNGTYAGVEGIGDIEIQFALATRDPNCNLTSGIDRLDGSSIPNYAANGVNASTAIGATELSVKNSSRWDPYRYYNIWVVNKIDGADGTAGQFIAGYAYFPGSSPSLDGTIMLATQMKSGRKTLPHEIGHALNLYHPFEGSGNATACPVNVDCSLDGDRVCDTDPISYNQTGGVIDFSCRTGTNSCTSAPYTIATEHNFMNYTSCFTLFTSGQKDRMLAAMSLPSRSGLAEASGLAAVYPAITYAPPAAACASASGPVGLSDHFAGLMNVSVAGRSFSSGTTRQDNGYLSRTADCWNLINLQSGTTYTISATLLGINWEQVQAWIDYNNNGIFDISERILRDDTIQPPPGNYPVIANTFTVPSSAVQGTVLRMRVIEELSTVHDDTYLVNGCYNPVYGQAEDFAVFISASTLPLTMEYFKGMNTHGVNRLLWRTSTESNTGTFDIERSYNGADYSRIATVAATSLSSGSNYSYDDRTYTGPVNYYRLKQIDNNGDYTYSNIVTIKPAAVNEGGVQILTNPFRDHFDLGIATPAPAKCVVNLLDATGKLVYTQTTQVSNKTILSVSPAGKELAAGLYIVQVHLNGKTITGKLVKE